MSLLAVQGGATGTGTVTLLAPVTNTNRTLTLPDSTGTLLDSTGSTTLTNLTVTNDASIQGLTVGRGAGAVATNTAVGASALAANTTGAAQVAVGNSALDACTTGNRNTAVGDNALGGVTTGDNNLGLGRSAGLALTTGVNNTFVGAYNGSNGGCGELITTGSKNTILGTYNGNQGGLDIRTASNNIVLSDGDGNPFVYGYNGYLAQNTNSGGRYVQYGFSIASVEKATIFWDNTNTNLYVRGASGGVYLTNTGTSWTSNSDERLKENLVPIENGLSKVCSLRSVIGNFIADETKKPTPFLIAQDVQAVLPEAVTTSTLKDDETNTEYLGVAYTEVIPLLVAAIKELKAIVDAQGAEIAALKGAA